MAYAFAAIAFGIFIIFSGWRGVSLADAAQGKAGHSPRKPSFASDQGLGASGNIGPAGGTPAGVGTFDGKPVCNWIIPILQEAKRRGWSGSVTSGYRSTADQARVCGQTSGPCAPPGHSRHQGTAYPSCAVDVSGASQLSGILQSMGGAAHGLTWAGGKDPVHFSVPSGGTY